MALDRIHKRGAAAIGLAGQTVSDFFNPGTILAHLSYVEDVDEATELLGHFPDGTTFTANGGVLTLTFNRVHDNDDLVIRRQYTDASGLQYRGRFNQAGNGTGQGDYLILTRIFPVGAQEVLDVTLSVAQKGIAFQVMQNSTTGPPRVMALEVYNSAGTLLDTVTLDDDLDPRTSADNAAKVLGIGYEAGDAAVITRARIYCATNNLRDFAINRIDVGPRIPALAGLISAAPAGLASLECGHSFTVNPCPQECVA